MPGSGKSFAAKRELVNVFLATRDRIIVVDPMGEYSPLIKRLGGQVIEIAPDSPHHINPMDIDLSFDEENPMALKADFILSLMELIVGGKDGLQLSLIHIWTPPRPKARPHRRKCSFWNCLQMESVCLSLIHI